MRYTTEFKLMCVELYRQGKWVKTPKGIKTANFRNKIRTWNRIEQAGGPEALCHKAHYKAWSPEEKLELVSQVNAGQSMMAVACQYGMSYSLLYQWVCKYREEGYNGLVAKKKGQHRKDQPMKRNTKSPKPLNESEREELIRLRAENAHKSGECCNKTNRLETTNGLQLKAKRGSNHPELRQEGHPLKYLLKFSD